MFWDLREQVSRQQSLNRVVQVLCDDNPELRRMGFTVRTREGDREEASYIATISIYDVGFSLENDFRLDERERLRRVWPSASGRRQIAQTLLTQLPFT